MNTRLLCLLLLFVLYSTSGISQGTTPEQGDPLQELRTSLSGLDPSRIPSGVLLNRMMLITDPHLFAGQGNTVASYSTFEQQYWEFYNASLINSQLPTLDGLRASIDQRVQKGAVPLLMLSYNHHQISATAAQDHLITIDSLNERVYDGPDFSRSPYTKGRLFSVALPGTTAESSIAVYVGPEYWLGNTPAPSSVRIDFGDGQGERMVSMGSTVTVQVNVAATNQQSVTAATSASASTTSALPIKVTDPATGLAAATTLQRTSQASIPPDLALGLLASRSWPGFTPTKGIYGPGGRATAIAWIKYANGNTSSPRKLRRPLVFVEGIDFLETRGREDHLRNLDINATGPIPLSNFTAYSSYRAGGYRNGEAGWNEVVDYNDEYKSLEKFNFLREQLQASASTTLPDGNKGGEYDIIYLDFSDGATLIQQNAMVLAELLEWINQPANRAPNAEETMVIGTSMGGQVARFALAWMEQQGLCHNSKLYVSFDSPHRGANVPIGIQHLLHRLEKVWIGNGSAKDVVDNKLKREATMQMTLFHFSNDAPAFRNQWLNWQASPDSYPSLLRKVAVSNGSSTAVLPTGMFPNMRMLYTEGASPITGTNNAYALPGVTQGNKANIVFQYRKAFSFSGKWFSSHADPSWGAYDTAPGSSQGTAASAKKESFVIRSDNERNTFMLTTSTLDVRDAGPVLSPNLAYNVTQQIPENNRPNRAKYAFDAYYAASQVNEPHVQITNAEGSMFSDNPSFYTDNATWIQNELRESAHQLPAALTLVYNFGSPYRQLLPSVQVNSGGELQVNNGNRPVSGGTTATQFVPGAGNFEMYTSNCGTRVQVNQGGRFTLGLVTGTHQATVAFADRSLLELRASSQTFVYRGSVLRIKRGGSMVVRNGAELQVDGKVIIEAGGFFCVEEGANLHFSSNAELYVDAAASGGANPVLGLGQLNCTGQLAICGQFTGGNSGNTNTAPTKTEALFFDGEDDLVTIPRASTYLSEFDQYGKQFAIEAYIRLDRRTDRSQTIFSNRRVVAGQANPEGILFALYGAHLFVQLNGINYGFETASNVVPNDGRPHHVAVTRSNSPDGSPNPIHFYIDGQLTSYRGTSTRSAYSGGNASIGGEYPYIGGYSQGFSGMIGEVRVWNYERSPADILNNMTTKLTAPQNGLIAYYDMQNPLGSQQLSDLSGVNATGINRQPATGYLGATNGIQNDDPVWKTECQLTGTVFGNFIYTPGTGPTVMLPDTVGQSTPLPGKNKFVEGLSVSPNPASNNAVLHFKQKLTSSISVRILDMMGLEHLVVLHNKQLEAGSQQVKLLLKDLKPGLYLVVIDTPAGQERIRLQVE